MTHFNRRAALGLLLALPAACSRNRGSTSNPGGRHDPPLYSNETPELRALINRYADHYGVPRELVQRVIARESAHRPGARNGPYYGLMQILPETAATMGYSGPPDGLLDAETNLIYGVKYLRGAWLVSDGDQDAAIMWYASGYYYEAKARGLLEETGLR